MSDHFLSLDRASQYAALFVLMGGLIALGAGAGLRAAMGPVVHALECSPGIVMRPTCATLLGELGDQSQTLLLLGVIAIACGGLALRYSRNAPSEQ